MPCDSVVTIGVNLELANRQLVLAALEKLGARYIQAQEGRLYFTVDDEGYWLEGGRLKGYSNIQAVADKLKLAYTKEAVSMAARRAGWTVAQGKAENKLAIQRRY